MSKLFENFDSISEKEWKNKVQVELKGLEYNESDIANHINQGLGADIVCLARTISFNKAKKENINAGYDIDYEVRQVEKFYLGI